MGQLQCQIWLLRASPDLGYTAKFGILEYLGTLVSVFRASTVTTTCAIHPVLTYNIAVFFLLITFPIFFQLFAGSVCGEDYSRNSGGAIEFPYKPFLAAALLIIFLLS